MNVASKSVSHSPISEHLKVVETGTVSFPLFRDIDPPTNLLGVGRWNLTKRQSVSDLEKTSSWDVIANLIHS